MGVVADTGRSRGSDHVQQYDGESVKVGVRLISSNAAGNPEFYSAIALHADQGGLVVVTSLKV